MDENDGISRKIEQLKNRDFPSDIKASEALNTAEMPALQRVRVFCRKRPFLPPFLHVGEKKERNSALDFSPQMSPLTRESMIHFLLLLAKKAEVYHMKTNHYYSDLLRQYPAY